MPRLPRCWSIPAGKSIGYRRLRREGFADTTSRDGRGERRRKRKAIEGEKKRKKLSRAFQLPEGFGHWSAHKVHKMPQML